MYKLIVGSTNPVKINAARRAAEKYWQNVDVIGCKVDSGISYMPMNKKEIRLGAKNRAINSYNYGLNNFDNVKNTIAIGLEGGVTDIDDEWYLFGATYLTDGNISSWGAEILVKMPNFIINKLENGKVELGTVIDQITGINNSKQKGGAVELLTNGKVLREDLFYFSIILGLSPWINGYWNKEN